MITKISGNQYDEMTSILYFMDADNKSLQEYIEGLKGRFDAIDKLVDSCFNGSRELLVSFISLNSFRIYQAEVVEER